MAPFELVQAQVQGQVQGRAAKETTIAVGAARVEVLRSPRC
jgi:hypothetical protein